MNKIIFNIVFFLMCNSKGNAQQSNNWLFPLNNGITFNTNPPTLLGNSPFDAQSLYSCATISNSNGSLLFSCDGGRVWDKNGNIMPNGDGLFGSGGDINTALIVPFIGDSLRYHVFISQSGIGAGTDQDTCKYSYNIVDMTLNNGLGDVTTKNAIIRYKAIEKMVAIPNANGSDIWWVCRDWTNNFFSYKINCNEFQNNNPVISNVGFNINDNTDQLISGDIKVSPNGKIVGACYRNYFELYQFNNSTGVLSNPIIIPVNQAIDDECYGIEFSPNSKFVYITGTVVINNIGLGFIRQYDLSTFNISSVQSSEINLNVDPLYASGGIQLGPNNKIYHNAGGKVVDVINNPNIQGLGCNFQDSVLILTNDAVRRFPYSYVNLITAQNVQATYTVAADCRTVTFTGKTYIKGNNLTFKWKWGEPAPIAGTLADSATQVVASQGDTTITTITHVYPPGIDTFFANLSVTSDTVCGTGRAGVKVIVKPPKPKANFGFSNTCNNLNVIFSDSSLLNFNPSLTYTYAYKPALAPTTAYTNFSSLANNNFTFATYDSFDIRLVVKSNLSCVTNDTIVKRIVLKAKPVAGFGYTNSCGSLQANITSAPNIAAGSIILQEYYLGNTLIGTGASFSYNFAAYGSYVVKHVVKSNFGCVSDTVPLTVIVKDKPTSSLSVLRDSVCANTNYTNTANASVNASTILNYTWLRNNVVLPNTSNQLTDNQTTGTYFYKVVATAANGCKSDTAYKTITVASKPITTINAANNCGSKVINITSTAQVTNDVITNYYISYGDGITSSTNPNNTTYTYANFGSYTLKYVVKGSVGCVSDTAYATLVVKDKPILNLTTARDSVCANTNYTITANAAVIASTISGYVWIKDGVVLPNITNSLLQNNITGIYIYKVVATAANGCKADTAYKTITVGSKPITTINVANNCGSKAINIASTAQVTNDVIANYYVSYGDGITSSTNPNNTNYIYANFGSYTLKYVVKGSVGCVSDTAFATVVVKDKPTLSIAYNNNACNNKNFTLTATSAVNASTITNYTWIRNNIILSNTGNLLIENQSTNNYIYKVVAIANTGCASDTAFQNVIVQNFPTTLFSANNGCVGNTIVLTNTSINNNPTAAITYSWTTNDGQTSNAVLPNFSFITSGTKNIQLKTNTQNNCADSIIKTITVDDFPVANFNITEACLGKKLAIVNNTTGATNYNWTTSNGQSSNTIIPDFIFNTVGNYTIKLIATSTNNCANTAEKNISIQAVQLFTRPAIDTNAVVGQPIQLSVIGAASYTWQWASSSGQVGSLQAANSSTPIFIGNSTGIYPLLVEGITAQGCKGTANIKVKIFTANNYVWIPNSFTPNGDGLNDKIKITCTGLTDINFIIYNRYGEKIYEQTTCSSPGWDGTYKGTLQPQGVYVYTWAGINFRGDNVKGEGTIMLVQ
jgi:gliding motility-associated-like protein